MRIDNTMLPRKRYHPDKHFSIGIPLKHSHGLMCSEMIFIGGQADIDGDAKVSCPNDPVAQTKIAMQHLLAGLGADLYDCVKSNVFNVEPGNQEDWKAAASRRASYFGEPGPAATGLSLTRLPREGLMLRYDVIAMRGLDGERLPREAVWPTNHRIGLSNYPTATD
jgi:enamine deaminase RidA (YjgF/YER057c/UK114 family)